MSLAARGLAGLGLAAMLAACAQDNGPAASTRRVYHNDLQGGAASCTVPRDVSLTAGQQAEARMTVGNDGGWCGISVSLPGPKPYDAGLLVERPRNGRVLVRKVGDITRIDYFPDPGFTGADSFTVRLLPGNPALKVAVTVQPGPATRAAAPAPAPAPARR